MEKIISVFDDVIPKKLSDYYETMIFGDCDGEGIFPTVPMYCNYVTEQQYDGMKSNLSFINILKSDVKLSEHFMTFAKIVELACHRRMGYNIRNVPVARINILMPSNTNCLHGDIHIDNIFDHLVLIYYVNDSDGDTFLFDDEGEVIKQISPKKGRVVVFDGSIKHAGGYNKEKPRAVINFNVELAGNYR
jgi:hypothetical protein